MYQTTHRPPVPNGPGSCPRCLAAVLWCLTEANRVPQAIDAARDSAGNQAVRIDHLGRYLVRQLTRDRSSTEGSESLHKPHVATCAAPAPRSAQRRLSSARVNVGVRPVRWQR
jgi:hypothetical protein